MTQTMCQSNAPVAATPAKPEPTWHFRPHTHIRELDDELCVTLELPGVARDQLHIHVEDGVLRIEGTVPQRDDTRQYFVREYGEGSYLQTLRIGKGIDTERIRAEYHDGVLTLHLVKAEQAKRRRIDIAVS